jgi:hypothetical protein
MCLCVAPFRAGIVEDAVCFCVINGVVLVLKKLQHRLGADKRAKTVNLSTREMARMPRRALALINKDQCQALVGSVPAGDKVTFLEFYDVWFIGIE